MDGLPEIIKRIEDGNFDNLFPMIQSYIAQFTGPTECLKLVRHISRYAYKYIQIEVGPNFVNEFTILIDFTMECFKKISKYDCSSQNDGLFKGLFYIVILGAKKKYAVQLMKILPSTTSLVTKCNLTSQENISMIKNCQISLSNLGVQCEDPELALGIQMFALQFYISYEPDMEKYKDHIFNCATFYSQKANSFSCLPKYYENIIQHMKLTFINRKTKIDTSSGIVFFTLIVEYGNVLYKEDKFQNFAKLYRPVITELDKYLGSALNMGLKYGTKLLEAGISHYAGDVDEQTMLKILHACIKVPEDKSINSVLTLSLMQIINLLCSKKNGAKLKLLGKNVMKLIFDLLLSHWNKWTDSNIGYKVVCTIEVLFSMYCSVTKDLDSNETETFYSHVPIWFPFLQKILDTTPIQDKEVLFYNIGIHLGNLGIITYRNSQYYLSAEFTKLSLSSLEHYIETVPEDKRDKVIQSIQKKCVSLQDAQRHLGQYWEAIVHYAKSFLKGYTTKSELVSGFIRLRRIAKKEEIKDLDNKTLFNVLQAACSDGENYDLTNIDSYEIVWAEFNYYISFSNGQWSKEMLHCAQELERSKILTWRLRGTLAVCWTYYLWPELIGDNCEIGSKHASDVILQISKEGQDLGIPLFEQIKAEAHFWVYMFAIRIVEKNAEKEVKEKDKPISMTAQATDLGEEAQVHDTCDVRPVVSTLSFDAQAETLEHLDLSLEHWEKIITRGEEIYDEENVCNYLTSIGNVYKFYGLLPTSLKCWNLLLIHAKRYDLKNYLLIAYRELLFLIPDILPSNIITDIKNLVHICEDNDPSSYHVIGAKAGLAYYYYIIGEFETGHYEIHQLVNNELMKKKTIRATEVQILIYFVASHYAKLPNIINPDMKFDQSCLCFAMNSCRCAIGLISIDNNCNLDLIGWKYHAAWLHHITAMWHGRLCMVTAQPRVLRAYLKKPLSIAQQFSIPFRVIELLSLLAECDLLTDKFEDCKTKIDGLEDILDVHRPKLKKSPSLEDVKPSIDNTKTPKNKQPIIYLDSSHKAGNTSIIRESDYELNDKILDDGKFIIGPEERVGNFTTKGLALATVSPSLTHREERHRAKKIYDCPQSAQCRICSSPVIACHLATVNALQAVLHAYEDRVSTAEDCIKMAHKYINNYKSKSGHIGSTLLSNISGTKKISKAQQEKFVSTNLLWTELHLSYQHAEILAINNKIEEAKSCNLSILSMIASFEPVKIQQHSQIIMLLTKQGIELQDVSHNLQISQNLKQNENVKNRELDPIDIIISSPNSENKLISKSTPILKNNFATVASDDSDTEIIAASPVVEQTKILPVPNAPTKYRNTRAKRGIKKDENKDDGDITALTDAISSMNIEESKSNKSKTTTEKKTKTNQTKSSKIMELTLVNGVYKAVKPGRGRPKTTKSLPSKAVENTESDIKSEKKDKSSRSQPSSSPKRSSRATRALRRL